MVSRKNRGGIEILNKLVFFDVFCLISIFALLFTVGFHIGDEREDYEKIQFEVVISPEKVSGSPDGELITLVDGKYECIIQEFERDRIVILCDGYYSEAGYLLSGAKYVSVNQPIKASQPWGYYDGRIYDVYRVPR